jgi:Domain of unknown function (DUF4337)
MAFSDLYEGLEHGRAEERNKWIGIYIGIIAALMALCAVGGGNATKDSTRFNIDLSDSYNYYQAKNIRQTSHMLAREHLQMLLKTQAGASPDARTAIEAAIAGHTKEIDRLESEPQWGEGKKELLAKAAQLKADRDSALRRDPYFDFAQALLQIAIVLASISIISGRDLLVWVSGGLAGLGTLLMLNGFTLLVKVPFIG